MSEQQNVNSTNESQQIPTLGRLPEVENRPDGQLSVDDVAAAIQVIDYASQQGAFRGWVDTIAVINLRNRLYAFVEAYRTAQQQNAESAGQAAEMSGDDRPAAETADAADSGDDGGSKEEKPKVRRRRVKGDA